MALPRRCSPARHPPGELPHAEYLGEAAPRLSPNVIAPSACDTRDRLDGGLDGVQEKAQNQDAGVDEQDDVADPALLPLGDPERRDEGNHQEDGYEAQGGELRMVRIHRGLGMEGSEGMQSEDLDDFADGEEDYLRNADGLHSSHGYAA